MCCVFVVGKVWRIVPCVSKIYTLGRFQFHGLLVSFSSPTRTRTRIPAHAHAHTHAHAHWQLVKAYRDHSRGGIPAVCVHDLANRSLLTRNRSLLTRNRSLLIILGGVSLQSVSTTWRNVWRCTPFLTTLGTHCISRSGPSSPTRSAYSPASPLSPWLLTPCHTHTQSRPNDRPF